MPATLAALRRPRLDRARRRRIVSSGLEEHELRLGAPILHRVAAGESTAIQECLDRYGGLVWSLARRFSKEASEAEDAAQEVFIELWKKAERFDPSLASEMTFVAMIARRRLIDRSRRKQRTFATETLDENPAVAVRDRGQAEVDLCDEAARASQALSRLKPEQRRVLELSIYGGLSHEEIARTTKLPLGTVKTHARRGLARVRELLGVAEASGAEGAGS
jgi:RNA polymerase sigma factor (sigma-70 family)